MPNRKLVLIAAILLGLVVLAVAYPLAGGSVGGGALAGY